jgi:hypothetical protein
MRHRPECIWEFRMNLSCKACAIAVLVAAGSLAYAAPPPAMPATPHRHKKSKSN